MTTVSLHGIVLWPALRTSTDGWFDGWVEGSPEGCILGKLVGYDVGIEVGRPDGCHHTSQHHDGHTAKRSVLRRARKSMVIKSKARIPSPSSWTH